MQIIAGTVKNEDGTIIVLTNGPQGEGEVKIPKDLVDNFQKWRRGEIKVQNIGLTSDQAEQLISGLIDFDAYVDGREPNPSSAWTLKNEILVASLDSGTIDQATAMAIDNLSIREFQDALRVLNHVNAEVLARIAETHDKADRLRVQAMQEEDDDVPSVNLSVIPKEITPKRSMPILLADGHDDEVKLIDHTRHPMILTWHPAYKPTLMLLIKLYELGLKAEVSGGAVRDMAYGLQIKDLDIGLRGDTNHIMETMHNIGATSKHLYDHGNLKGRWTWEWMGLDVDFLVWDYETEHDADSHDLPMNRGWLNLAACRLPTGRPTTMLNTENDNDNRLARQIKRAKAIQEVLDSPTFGRDIPL